MKQFSCGTVVPGCDGVMTGETEDELLAAAAEHAEQVHGMTEIPPELVDRIRAGIVDV
jgi:predicted small metal-binding protein